MAEENLTGDGIATETEGRTDAPELYGKEIDKRKTEVKGALSNYGDDYQDIWQRGGMRRSKESKRKEE